MAKDLESAIARLAATQHGVLTTTQALATGMSHDAIGKRIKRGRWERVARGVHRIAGAPGTWEQRLMIGVLAARSGGAVARRSAAALWELPGFPREPVDVVELRGRHGILSCAGGRSSNRILDRHID